MRRLKPFEFYTASDLWTDEYTSEQMLKFHLDGSVNLSSRRSEFIERSTKWITARFNVGSSTKNRRIASNALGLTTDQIFRGLLASIWRPCPTIVYFRQMSKSKLVLGSKAKPRTC